MANQHSIDILLATYNGAPYLEEQLNSLLNQTDTNWRLLIRDDGSSDETSEIIARHEGLHSDKTRVLRDARGNLGPIGNFSALMEASDADYVMFCDQDDVWLPDKIAKSRSAMTTLESAHGTEIPLLVHTDLKLANDALEELRPSFFQHLMIDPVRSRTLERLLVQNIAPGCTMMFNRKLCELAAPVPKNAMMHDWWVILIAAALGAVDCVAKPLVLYRLHTANTVGVSRRPLRETVKELLRMPLAVVRQNNRHLRKTQCQADALLAARQLALCDDVRQRTSRYASIRERGFISKRIDLLRFGYLPTKPLRKFIRFFVSV